MVMPFAFTFGMRVAPWASFYEDRVRPQCSNRCSDGRPRCVQKLIFQMCPPVPTTHPALGLPNATAHPPVTPGRTYHVVPSSEVHAAPPQFAVTTTYRASAWHFKLHVPF